MVLMPPTPVEATGPHLDIPFGLRGLRKCAFWVAVWTFLGLLQAARLYIAYHSGGRQLISMPQALTWGLADWYLWGLLSPAIFSLTRSTAFGPGRWPRDLLLHLAAAPLFAAAQLFAYALVYQPLGTLFWHEVGQSQDWTVWTLYLDLVRSKLHAGVITYFLIAFLYFTLHYNARFRKAEEHRAQLSAQLATAQLNALKMQLQPHFLFNTLNAITSLIHSNPEAADRMTTGLGELLRTTLDLEAVQEVPLHKEVEFLSRYLEIQSLRFSDRLTFDIAVEDAVREALLPVLLLQPLVENAVEHGVAPRSQPSRVQIHARRVDAELVISVANAAPEAGETRQPERNGGRGLANTRARIAELYGTQGSLVTATDNEFRVTVRLPFHTAPWVKR